MGHPVDTKKNLQIHFHNFLCMDQSLPPMIILHKKDIFGRHTIDNFCIISLKRVHTFDGKHDNRIKMAGFKASPLEIIGPKISFYVDDLFSHNCCIVIFYSLFCIQGLRELRSEIFCLLL